MDHMNNVDGIGGFNKIDGTTKLIAAFGNDLVDVQTGLGYKQNISSGNKAEFETLLDNMFFQNYKDQPRHFDGITWKKTLNNKTPLARYMKRWKTQLYLGNCKFPQQTINTWDKDPISSTVAAADITFPSRVFYPDVPSDRKTLKWGLLYSSKFSTVANEDNKLRLSSVLDVGFIEAGIKFGDPVFILSGDDRSIGQYTISSVDSNNQVTLLQKVPVKLTNASGWCGSNWFDVNTDDGDQITWLGENSDRLLAFKNNTLHRYDKSSIRQIKGVPGTTSGRSVQNIKDTYTMYFHGSLGNRTGFYLTDGVGAKKQSNPIDHHIRAILAAGYDDVVAWTEGDLYRAWVGDLSNTNYNIAMSKAIFTYDITTDTWSIDPNPKTILCATQLRESGQLNTYIADNDSSVFRTGTETVFSYDGSPIPFSVETRIAYPLGSESLNDFTRVEIIARNARGTQVQYRLYNTPLDSDSEWRTLGDIKADKTEIKFPRDHSLGCGYQYRFIHIGTREPDFLIEKISTFYVSRGAPSVNIS